MQYKAIQKYVKMTPRKLRLVAGMIKDLTPSEAVEMLPYVRKAAAGPLRKVIMAAVANAKGQGAKEEELVFNEIQIGDGPRLKRGQPVSRGQWHPVVKRWSHICVVLSDGAKQKKDSIRSQKEGIDRNIKNEGVSKKREETQNAQKKQEILKGDKKGEKK